MYKKKNTFEISVVEDVISKLFEAVLRNFVEFPGIQLSRSTFLELQP